jgi:hypothetical protein
MRPDTASDYEQRARNSSDNSATTSQFTSWRRPLANRSLGAPPEAQLPPAATLCRPSSQRGLGDLLQAFARRSVFGVQ